jgi:hypothetical protein
METGNSKIFQKKIQLAVADKLSKYILIATSNMLSIDFSLRNIQKDVEFYATECANKIHSYLGSKKFIAEDFSDVLTLFSVAISDKKVNYQDDNNTTVLASINNDVLIDQIFKNCPDLSKLTDEEKRMVKEILLNLKTIDKSLNFNVLLSDTKVISKGISHLLDQNSKHKEKVIEEIISFVKLQKDTGYLRSRSRV